MPIPEIVSNVLNTTGLAGFGISMPIISPAWTNGVMPAFNETNLSLQLSDTPTTNSWVAPLAGVVQKIEENPADNDEADPTQAILKTLIKADGGFEKGPGLLLKIYPQQYLRLSRLYLQLFEDPASAGANPLVLQARNLGHAVRPVPCYFFYSGDLTFGDTNGHINPGEELGKNGKMSIYDEHGFPIDALAVASVFSAILLRHGVLQQRDVGLPPNTTNMQITNIANLAGATPVTRCRLSLPGGQAYDGANLTGISPAPPQASGLFTMNVSAGGAPTVNVAGVSASFTAEQRRLLLVGPISSGQYSDSFITPSLPAVVTLQRDYFNVGVLKLDSYLLGNPVFPGPEREQKPRVRTNEPITFLLDGNDLLGAASTSIPAGSTESLVVASDINTAFPMPTEAGDNGHWPNFPVVVGTPPVLETVPIDIKENLNPEATVFDDGDANTANLDIILTLNNLPEGVAIRVYNRKFTAEADEERGGGAGGIVPAGGTISLRLKDPLGIREPGVPENTLILPANSFVLFDLIVILRNDEKTARIFGNIRADIETANPETTDPTPSDANILATAERTAVSKAGILGLEAPDCTINAGSDFLETIKCLSGEADPRDAPRFPTMARRDLLVAGLSGTTWRGVLGAGRLTRETLSADQRLGAPGGLGGRETQSAGIASQNGQIAYDIARMAIRRTDNIIERLEILADTNWTEPNALIPGVGNSGPIAAAVLQTIAPFCDTPEFGLLKSEIDPDDFPDTFQDLIDFIIEEIDDIIPGSTPGRTSLLNQIRTELNNLLASIGITPQNRERLYGELKREVSTAIFGRRDAQWSLEEAINNAKDFIYIETPGFGATSKDYVEEGVPVPAENYHLNLIKKLQTRLNEVPGLHAIICTPKIPDYGKGYEPFAAFEMHARNTLIRELPKERVVSFHPIGFPGRHSNLESTVVIVDDIWAMAGSSVIRRRGLTFDGGSDVVFADTERIGGKSPLIADFRRRLQAIRLGISAEQNSDFGEMADPNFTRLKDGQEAFYVIREMLVLGGLGKIGRLFNASEPTPIEGLSIDLVNPDGHEFNLTEAIVTSLFASIKSF